MIIKCNCSTTLTSISYPTLPNMDMSCRDVATGRDGMEVMLNLLTSTDYKWTNSPELLSILKPTLMRLCAR